MLWENIYPCLLLLALSRKNQQWEHSKVSGIFSFSEELHIISHMGTVMYAWVDQSVLKERITIMLFSFNIEQSRFAGRVIVQYVGGQHGGGGEGGGEVVRRSRKRKHLMFLPKVHAICVILYNFSIWRAVNSFETVGSWKPWPEQGYPIIYTAITSFSKNNRGLTKVTHNSLGQKDIPLSIGHSVCVGMFDCWLNFWLL